MTLDNHFFTTTVIRLFLPRLNDGKKEFWFNPEEGIRQCVEYQTIGYDSLQTWRVVVREETESGKILSYTFTRKIN